MAKTGLKIVRKRIDKLSSDPANARKHDEKNLDAIVASLRRFGQQKPIVVDKSDVVRAGNGTLAAATHIGWEYIDCVVSDLESSEMISFAIADNRTAELADWDDEILAAQLQGLDDTLVEAAGFTEEDMAAIEKMANSLDEEIPDGEEYEPLFQVIVDCKDESSQRLAFEKLSKQGFACKCQQV